MKKSKLQRLRFWLQSGHSITPRQAISKFQYFRLADGIMKLRVIYRLNIVTTIVRTKSSVHAKYSIPD